MSSCILFSDDIEVHHQAADWISPVNAARTASSKSASVKPRCSCRRAITRSRKTPRFSIGTRSAAAQTARKPVKASMSAMVLAAAGDCQREPAVDRRTSHYYCAALPPAGLACAFSECSSTRETGLTLFPQRFSEHFGETVRAEKACDYCTSFEVGGLV